MSYHEIETTEDQDPCLYKDTDECLPKDDSTYPPANKSCSRRFVYILIVEHALLAFILLACWRAFVPTSTNLRYQTLTADNKSFPSGPLSWSQDFEAIPCGRTPEEAKARGCRFDMIVTAWLPPRCIDDELVDEFMTLGDWQFYTEAYGTTQHASYQPEYLGSFSEPGAIWTSRSWHHMHCLYMWKKIGRALVNGTMTDAETVSEPHAEHCMQTMQDLVFGPHRDPNAIETALEIVYPPC